RRYNYQEIGCLPYILPYVEQEQLAKQMSTYTNFAGTTVNYMDPREPRVGGGDAAQGNTSAYVVQINAMGATYVPTAPTWYTIDQFRQMAQTKIKTFLCPS